MEIRLKTAEEFRDAHMTIEIRATRDEAWRLSDRLYTADEVGHYQASEAELVATPLRARITELEKTLAEAEQDRDNRLEELEAAERYQHERAQEARQSIAARDRLLATATTRVRAAAEILGQKRVAEAADEIVTTKGAILADAVRNALAALSE